MGIKLTKEDGVTKQRLRNEQRVKGGMNMNGLFGEIGLSATRLFCIIFFPLSRHRLEIGPKLLRTHLRRFRGLFNFKTAKCSPCNYVKQLNVMVSGEVLKSA